MRKFSTYFVIALASACLSTTSAFAASDIETSVEAPSSTPKPGPAPTKHALYSTWIDTGYNFNPLVAGFNSLDSTTVTCANAAGCTIVFDIMSQAGDNTVSGNRWAIVAYVDGSSVHGGPYQGTLPVDGSYVMGNYHDSLPVAKGTHTVSFSLYVGAATGLSGAWQATYAVYKP
jgi:hypothetical protein